MKKMILLVAALALLATAAQASVFGVRGGLSVDPDQVHLGAHVDMGRVVPPLRLVPNLEVGFGNDVTVTALNGALQYDVPRSRFYVGGELGIIHTSWNGPAGTDHSDSEVGLSGLGGFRSRLASGQEMMFEFKLGLANSPDFKFTVGISVF